MTPEERTDPAVSEAEPGGDGDQVENGKPDPLAELTALLTARLEILVASVKTLVAVHTDRAQLAIRRRIQTAVVGLLAACVGATVLVYATIHVVRGTAQGLAELFDGRIWLGSLAAGLLFLALAVGGLLLGLRRWDKKQLEKQQAKYAGFRSGLGETREESGEERS